MEPLAPQQDPPSAFVGDFLVRVMEPSHGSQEIRGPGAVQLLKTFSLCQRNNSGAGLKVGWSGREMRFPCSA